VKIGELSLFGALFALGCATGSADVEPRAANFDAAASSDVAARAANPDAIASSDLESRALISGAVGASDFESIEALIDDPPPLAIPETRLSVFGAITTDSEGRLSILPAHAIRNAENALYGWRIWVGRTSEPVRWTETLTAPVGVERIDDPELAISEDGRAVAFENAMVPDQGFIFSQWALGADEAPGRYELAVSLADGRTERFSFLLGQPQDACPSMKILLNWWGAKHSLEGDPGNRDVSDRVLKVFGARIARHGFVTADLEDAYWYVMASAARRSDDRAIAYGHIVMRAIADFQGKARRYSSATNFTGRIDYGVLFDSPVDQLDDFIRTLADNFAGILSPHAREACSDWWSGQLEEEARLEEVRTQLEEEIRRVRERRTEREKRLELDVTP
jgi:hypothetical protein